MLLAVPLSVMTGDNKNGDWRLPLSLSAGLSRSVTFRPFKVGQMLQIEILLNRVSPLSRSVTSGADFAELLLQIEIFP